MASKNNSSNGNGNGSGSGSGSGSSINLVDLPGNCLDVILIYLSLYQSPLPDETTLVCRRFRQITYQNRWFPMLWLVHIRPKFPFRLKHQLIQMGTNESEVSRRTIVIKSVDAIYGSQFPIVNMRIFLVDKDTTGRDIYPIFRKIHSSVRFLSLMNCAFFYEDTIDTTTLISPVSVSPNRKNFRPYGNEPVYFAPLNEQDMDQLNLTHTLPLKPSQRIFYLSDDNISDTNEEKKEIEYDDIDTEFDDRQVYIPHANAEIPGGTVLYFKKVTKEDISENEIASNQARISFVSPEKGLMRLVPKEKSSADRVAASDQDYFTDSSLDESDHGHGIQHEEKEKYTSEEKSDTHTPVQRPFGGEVLYYAPVSSNEIDDENPTYTLKPTHPNYQPNPINNNSEPMKTEEEEEEEDEDSIEMDLAFQDQMWSAHEQQSNVDNLPQGGYKGPIYFSAVSEREKTAHSYSEEKPEVHKVKPLGSEPNAETARHAHFDEQKSEPSSSEQKPSRSIMPIMGKCIYLSLAAERAWNDANLHWCDNIPNKVYPELVALALHISNPILLVNQQLQQFLNSLSHTLRILFLDFAWHGPMISQQQQQELGIIEHTLKLPPHIELLSVANNTNYPHLQQQRIQLDLSTCKSSIKYISLIHDGWSLIRKSICDSVSPYPKLKYLVIGDRADLTSLDHPMLKKQTCIERLYTPCLPKLSYARQNSLITSTKMSTPTKAVNRTEETSTSTSLFECISEFPNFNEVKHSVENIAARQLLRELNTRSKRYLLWGMFFIEDSHKDKLRQYEQEDNLTETIL